MSYLLPGGRIILSSVLRIERQDTVLDRMSLLNGLGHRFRDTLALLSRSLFHVEHFQQVVVAEVALIAAHLEEATRVERCTATPVLTLRLVLKAKSVED